MYETVLRLIQLPKVKPFMKLFKLMTDPDCKDHGSTETSPRTLPKIEVALFTEKTKRKYVGTAQPKEAHNQKEIKTVIHPSYEHPPIHPVITLNPSKPYGDFNISNCRSLCITKDLNLAIFIVTHIMLSKRPAIPTSILHNLSLSRIQITIIQK